MKPTPTLLVQFCSRQGVFGAAGSAQERRVLEQDCSLCVEPHPFTILAATVQPPGLDAAPCRLTATQKQALVVLRRAWPARVNFARAGLSAGVVVLLGRLGLAEVKPSSARAFAWCRSCGCTDVHGCGTGCSWVEPPTKTQPGLCSACELNTDF